MAGEIESMASNMRSKMRCDTISSSTPCIFRIPNIFRRHNKEAYIPNAFSIGPFHHGRDAGVVQKGENDPIFSTSCMLQFLYHGLILLENQIPWFVLELLFSLTSDSFETKPLLQLALVFFDNIFSAEKSPIQLDLFANQEIQHILDLIRSSLVLPLGEQQGQEESSVSCRPISSATSIKESGISFRTSLLQLALVFFDNIFSYEKSPIQLNLFANQEIQHILDLIRSSLVLPLGEQQGQEESSESWRTIPSATSIKESGISFRTRDSALLLPAATRNKKKKGTKLLATIFLSKPVESLDISPSFLVLGLKLNPEIFPPQKNPGSALLYFFHLLLLLCWGELVWFLIREFPLQIPSASPTRQL
ncbi:hypothetical protein SLEP1_g48928 [Rubroshorea leprosula]|uniref:Uncharacterized protein n=1 Tax=Rubroshorea leprosula TaxID=152421 RepID=A0AAV5LVZ3_9ROSI|nr:hypothetical protein SLEP1_g48928 [Rubroshorea leprosula]